MPLLVELEEEEESRGAAEKEEKGHEDGLGRKIERLCWNQKAIEQYFFGKTQIN